MNVWERRQMMAYITRTKLPLDVVYHVEHASFRFAY